MTVSWALWMSVTVRSTVEVSVLSETMMSVYKAVVVAVEKTTSAVGVLLSSQLPVSAADASFNLHCRDNRGPKHGDAGGNLCNWVVIQNPNDLLQASVDNA